MHLKTHTRQFEKVITKRTHQTREGSVCFNNAYVSVSDLSAVITKFIAILLQIYARLSYFRACKECVNGTKCHGYLIKMDTHIDKFQEILE